MYNDRLRSASSDGGACQTLTTRVHNLNLVVWCDDDNNITYVGIAYVFLFVMPWIFR